MMEQLLSIIFRLLQRVMILGHWIVRRWTLSSTPPSVGLRTNTSLLISFYLHISPQHFSQYKVIHQQGGMKSVLQIVVSVV